jgi:antitoxin (DNA-binding transcriptional repressor) of toxin-antitoxin stability system
MKTVNVRELREAIPKLRETLATDGELLLVSNGEPVARVLPTDEPRRPKLQSLKALRGTIPMSPVPIEVLIREERDRR